jgi:hypothetical protein
MTFEQPSTLTTRVWHCWVNSICIHSFWSIFMLPALSVSWPTCIWWLYALVISGTYGKSCYWNVTGHIEKAMKTNSGKMEDCWHPYHPAATNGPEKGRSENPKSHHRVSYPARSKALSYPQIEKQLTPEGMGRMTCSSTLLIPHPWSPLTAPGSIMWYSLGSKSYFPAHTGIQSSMLLPTTWPATFTLKLQGNQHPCASRTLGFHYSTGNRRHKPLGLVSPEATPQNWVPWSPCGRSA